jgi:transcriptional regulator with XRE-family HTH domain
MKDPIPDLVFDGSRLKALRFERGLSAEEAARRANVSLRHLLRLEAGQRPNTSAVTLTRVALALDTTVEYLLGITNDDRSIGGRLEDHAEEAAR